MKPANSPPYLLWIFITIALCWWLAEIAPAHKLEMVRYKAVLIGIGAMLGLALDFAGFWRLRLSLLHDADLLVGSIRRALMMAAGMLGMALGL